MYDGGKIIPGLIIFVCLGTFAIWYGSGDTKHVPKPEKPAGYTNCVKPTEFMKQSHMVLLNQWRDEVLREGKREQVKAGDGKMYEKSLQNGCMHCHTSKEKFCDECHNYASVKPYCWDCHMSRTVMAELEEAK